MRLALKLFEKPNCVLSRGFRHQFLAALSVDIIFFAHGVGTGWFSPTLPKLLSSGSPLNFDIELPEASWIGSLVGLGSTFGTLLFGFLLDRVGRKICIYLLTLPHICLWVLVYCAESVEFLYVARFLGGMTGGGSFVVLPIFVSEIADSGIRGTLSAMMMLSMNFGILIGYIVATYLDYHLIPCLIIALPFIYLGATKVFPETPQYLLRKGQLEAAEKSFKFYKNCADGPGNYNELQQCNLEFVQLKAYIEKNSEGSGWRYRDFVTKPALKAFCTAAVILFVNQFSGSFAFINYMSHIFAEAGSELLHPNTCTIITGGVQIFGACVATVLVDRCGRKLLMLLSTGGLGLFLTAFGTFIHIGKSRDLTDFGWVPLVLMMVIVFLTNIGIIALTFVLLVEIFPAKIRSVAASGSLVMLSVLVFCTLKIFPIYMDLFGLSVTMWSCAAVCLGSFVYFAIFLPETKGKSMTAD